jgi:hypothetical protein
MATTGATVMVIAAMLAVLHALVGGRGAAHDARTVRADSHVSLVGIRPLKVDHDALTADISAIHGITCFHRICKSNQSSHFSN